MKNSIFLLTMIFTLFSFFNANAQWNKGSIKGEGAISKKIIDVGTFEGISFGLAGNLEVTQGSRNEVEVEAQSNLIDNIIFEVKGGTLYIKNEKNVRNAKPIRVYITTPTLNEANLSGSGSFITKSKFTNSGNVNVKLSGSGNMDLDIEGADFETSISGSGSIIMSGKGHSNNVKISGSGNFSAKDLITQNCSVAISGSGNCRVHVTDQLDGRISGSGSVFYAGNPRVTAKVSGSGKVTGI